MATCYTSGCSGPHLPVNISSTLETSMPLILAVSPNIPSLVDLLPYPAGLDGQPAQLLANMPSFYCAILENPICGHQLRWAPNHLIRLHLSLVSSIFHLLGNGSKPPAVSYQQTTSPPCLPEKIRASHVKGLQLPNPTCQLTFPPSTFPPFLTQRCPSCLAGMDSPSVSWSSLLPTI